jgi:arsenite-transporting ATPase
VAPLRQDEVTGVAALAAHGDALFTGCQPEEILAPAPRIRFTRDGGRYRATFPLPGASSESLEVLKVEDELVVRAGERRRSLVLPRRMAALDVEGAKLSRGELTVSFAAMVGG